MILKKIKIFMKRLHKRTCAADEFLLEQPKLNQKIKKKSHRLVL